MRIAGFCLLFISFLLYTGSGRRRGSVRPIPTQNSATRHPAYASFHRQIAHSLTNNDYAEAQQLYRGAAAAANARGDPFSAGVFRVNEASSLMATGRFREALSVFLEAREQAEAIGDTQTIQRAHFGLANLYLSFGDQAAAAAAAREGALLLRTETQAEVKFPLLLILGRLEARERGFAAGLPYFREAIWTAQEIDDRALGSARSREAEAWNHFGFEALRANKLDTAEDALCRAWSLRLRFQDARASQSYPLLAQLYYARHQPARAQHWIDLALVNSSKLHVLQPWFLRYQSGLIAEALGRPDKAIANYKLALAQARDWRASVLAADQFLTEAEVQLSDLFDAFLRVSEVLPREQAPLEASYAVLQESKAWSLRVQLEQSATRSVRLPSGYPAELERVRRLETSLLAAENPQLRAEAELRRLRLIEMETAAGLSARPSDRPADHDTALSPDEAVLTFHTDEPHSQLWLKTSSSLRRVRIPSRSNLVAAAKEFRTLLAENSPLLRRAGAKLLDNLLGPLKAEALSRPEWRLVLDDGLFDIPFAALSVNEGEFVVENHTVLQVPNLAAHAAREPWNGSFLGLADPILNRADPRRTRTATTLLHSLWPFRRSAAPALEFSTLPGSRAEVQLAASVWSSAHLLTGETATAEDLKALVAREKPSILHFATHAIPLAGGSAGLVFSMDHDGTARIFGPRDVMALDAAPALVIMSACHSGAGPELPGSGVIGLVRAWLAAGSQDVIASHWPVPDDTGPLFLSLYRYIATRSTSGRFAVAAGLRQAQRECLRADGYRSQPRYWAGFYIAGKG